MIDNTITTFTVEQLRAGLETLPQEMYDRIFNYTFTWDKDTVILNPVSRRPSPVQLQVNHQTREEFLKCYYKEITLVVLDSAIRRTDGGVATHKWVSSWFKSLSEGALEVLLRRGHSHDTHHRMCSEPQRLPKLPGHRNHYYVCYKTVPRPYPYFERLELSISRDGDLQR